jgi:eukaryotic-like serine/threonine-protein kinase
MRAMRKDPAGRYQTAEDLRADLVAVLRGQTPSAPPPMVAAAGGYADPDASTRVIPSAATPPATAPPDEVYRQLEEEPPSQLPFILTAFGLLGLLTVLVFVLFQALGGGDEPETVTIPNVTNVPEEEAVQRLEDEGLVVRITREPSEEIEQGRAIRTDPPAGESLEEGSTIELFISAGPAESEVPPLIGQDEATARQLIEDAGFVVGNITTRPDEQPEGIVVEQSPPAGVRAGEGSPIDLVISEGPQTVDLPTWPDSPNATPASASATRASASRWRSSTTTKCREESSSRPTPPPARPSRWATPSCWSFHSVRSQSPSPSCSVSPLRMPRTPPRGPGAVHIGVQRHRDRQRPQPRRSGRVPVPGGRAAPPFPAT